MYRLVHAFEGWLACLLLLGLWSCHDTPRRNPLDPALTPPVELSAALDNTAGTVTLTWSQYQGAQPFAEYRVLRQVQGLVRVDTLARIADVRQTWYVDSTLAPDTGYEYRVAVVNVSGFAAPSDKQSLAGYSLGAVQMLPIQADSLAGALVLRWHRFVGPDFQGYQVFRRKAESIEEDTLAAGQGVADTVLADSTARAGVLYVVSSAPQEARLELPPVQFLKWDFDSHTATATLSWTRYAGPRFQSYQVLRHTATEASYAIFETMDSADTSFVDSHLMGNTEYSYQVVTLTGRGEEVPSEERSGAFHRLVGTWPVPMDQERGARLYARPGRQIEVLFHLLNDSERYLVYDSEGTLLQEVPLSRTSLAMLRYAGMACREDGQRFLALASVIRGAPAAIVQCEGQGNVSFQEVEPFADALAQPLGEAEQGVLGEVRLLIRNTSGLGLSFAHLTVSAGDTTAYAYDPSVEPTLMKLPPGWVPLQNTPELSLSALTDTAWHDFRFEADANRGEGQPGIQIGSDSLSSFALGLDFAAQQVWLDRVFEPPAGSGLERQEEHLREPFELLSTVAYRLILEVRDGRVRAAVRRPVVLWKWMPPVDWSTGWASLAAAGDGLAFTVGENAFSVDAQGQGQELPALDGAVAETRIWQVTGQGRKQAGVCLPVLGQVLWGPLYDPLTWTSGFNRAFGPELGAGNRPLHYPLSLDGSPDGRVYLLDAGNSRVVVLDRMARYLTEWGGWGSGSGQLNCGTQANEYAGSLCVDENGYIYVADVYNQRIQKFAP